MTNNRRLWAEILVVTAVTFGTSGLRAILRLIDDLLAPTSLNEQQVTLNQSQSPLPLLDVALQLSSALVLFAWGALALLLLAYDGRRLTDPRASDLGWGALLAAVIGIPGLALYVTAVQLGLSKVVAPTGFDNAFTEIPLLLTWSAANAFGEEIVVVAWLMTRLRQLRIPLAGALAASALLRGSYHLYQGISAGLGNIVMGVVYGWFFARTGRITPLIIAHFLIDAIAFVGYALLAPHLGWLLPTPGGT